MGGEDSAERCKNGRCDDTEVIVTDVLVDEVIILPKLPIEVVPFHIGIQPLTFIEQMDDIHKDLFGAQVVGAWNLATGATSILQRDEERIVGEILPDEGNIFGFSNI
jgi:hypothetical protein